MGSSIPAYSKNHVVNPDTGFMENPAFLDSFDSDKKKLFLELYDANTTDLYGTCQQMHVHHNTVNKHYQLDPVFKQAYDEIEYKYAHQLQAVGRKNALKDRSVVERIWVQKSLSHLPGFEKYSDQKNIGNVQITLNIDGKTLEMVSKRNQTIDAEEIKSIDSIEMKNEILDESSTVNQRDRT